MLQLTRFRNKRLEESRYEPRKMVLNQKLKID